MVVVVPSAGWWLSSSSSSSQRFCMNGWWRGDVSGLYPIWIEFNSNGGNQTIYGGKHQYRRPGAGRGSRVDPYGRW
jgi:hypothetical protein